MNLNGTASPLWLLVVLVGFALLWLAEPALAGFGQYFSGMANRTRVIQICVVAMAIGLFILLKKFADVSDRNGLAC